MSFEVKQSDQEIQLLYSKKLCALFNSEKKEIYQILQSIASGEDIKTMILTFDQVESSFFGYVDSKYLGDFNYFGLTDINGKNYGLIQCSQQQALLVSKLLSKEIPNLSHKEIGEFTTTVVVDESSALRVLIGVPLGVLILVLIGFGSIYLGQALPLKIVNLIEKLYNNLWILYLTIPIFFVVVGFIIDKDHKQ